MDIIRNKLIELKNEDYKKFSTSIVNSNYPLLGVKTDILKKIAKENIDLYKEYFNTKHYYYEEFFIHGLMLGYLKIPFDELVIYIDQYIPMINSWALVDSIVSNLKIMKKNITKSFELASEYIKSNEEFKVRFGYCILLCYFINDKKEDYLDSILKLCNKKHKQYYIQMMVAWLLSILYIKFPKEGLEFLNNNELDVFTFNKTISKICDSYRVSIEDKNTLKKLRRK